MQICTEIKEKVESLLTERSKHVIKRDLDDDSGAHLTSFGIEFQTDEEAKKERSPSAALLCAGLLRRGIVYEMERLLRGCEGIFCSMSSTYDCPVLL